MFYRLLKRLLGRGNLWGERKRRKKIHTSSGWIVLEMHFSRCRCWWSRSTRSWQQYTRVYIITQACNNSSSRGKREREELFFTCIDRKQNDSKVTQIREEEKQKSSKESARERERHKWKIKKQKHNTNTHPDEFTCEKVNCSSVIYEQ